MRNTDYKLPLIIGVGVIAVILLCIFAVQGAQNNAYSYEESIYNNPPIKDNLLCLSVELVNDIAFHIYCYDVEIVE